MTSGLIGAEAADPGAKAPNLLLSLESRVDQSSTPESSIWGLGEPWLLVRYAGSVIPRYFKR